jgi:hypothetical protein
MTDFFSFPINPSVGSSINAETASDTEAYDALTQAREHALAATNRIEALYAELHRALRGISPIAVVSEPGRERR